MLTNLDNEVYFKKVFTDVEVFTAFVKDVLGVDIEIDKVETEKVLSTKPGAIKFRMDLFAEDKKNRTIVEIQKVDYDYSFDRFTHYFLGNLIDTQRTSKTYEFAKDVYLIVVVTAAYRISDINGLPIKDDILIADVNPRNLKGEIRKKYNHKMVVLNTNYLNKDTPQKIRDWLDLIIESIKNPENPLINLKNPAIAKAAQLAEMNDVSSENMAEAKEQEMRKITIAKVENETIQNAIVKSLELGFLTKNQIAATFNVTEAYVDKIEFQLKNGYFN